MKKLFFVIVGLLVIAALARGVLPAVLENAMNKVQEHPPYEISAQAKALHQSLFIVDLHSDALLWKRSLASESSRGHVDLPRLQRGNVALQVFSATTKSPRGQNYTQNSSASDNITQLALVQGWPVATWRSLMSRAEYQLEKLHDLVANNSQEMRFVRSKRDLLQLIEARKNDPKVVGAMYLIEGAHPLEGSIENLNTLQARGLHFVGITHFFDNELGGSLHGESHAGLTPFGRNVIQRAGELEMTIDIAHSSAQVVKDILAMSTRPVVLSHGGFKGNCESDRNLDDELMLEVAEAGGIIGVGYWEGAICDATPAGIVRAIRYGVDLLGVEHIALGSDFDGAVATPFDTSELAVLTQTMLDEGFTEGEIRAVLGANMQQFLLAQLPE